MGIWKNFRSKMKFIFTLFLVLVLICGCFFFIFFSKIKCSKTKVEFISCSLPEHVNNLDPQTVTTAGELSVVGNAFEGLYRKKLDGSFELGVASNVEISKDGLTYTFTIKNNIPWRFHTPNNKTPDNVFIKQKVTAGDFLFAFQRLFDPNVTAPFCSDYFFIKNAKKIKEGDLPMSKLGVRAESGNRLIIELDHYVPTIKELLSNPPAMPCNKNFYESTNGCYGKNLNTILCDGAFYLHSWINSGPNKKIRLRPNTSNPHSKDIKVGGVNFSFKQQNELGAMLRKKEIDVAFFSNPEKFSSYSAKSIDKTLTGFVLNRKNPLFKNSKIRKALALTTNRQALEKKLLENQKITSFIIPNSVRLGDKKYRELVGSLNAQPNLNLAKQLYKEGLSELKADGSSSSNLKTIISLNPLEPALNQQLQFWQQHLGAFFKAETPSSTDYQNRLNSGNFEIAVVSLNCDFSSPFDFLNQFAPTSPYTFLRTDNKNLINTINFSSKQNNFSNMAKTFFDAECIICQEDCAFIPIYFQNEFLLQNNSVKNVIFNECSKQLNFNYASKQ